MSEAPIEGVEVTSYFVETFVPTANTRQNSVFVDEITAMMGLYLLDLMKGHGYRVVSGVRYCVPEPGPVAPFPDGWALLRACVDVQEFDVEIG